MHFSNLLILVIGLIMSLVILIILLTILIIIIGLIWRIGSACNRFVETIEERFINPTPPRHTSSIPTGNNRISTLIRSRGQIKPGDYVGEDISGQSSFSPLEGRQFSSASAEPELNKNTIVIAVDATPKRGGGLLILPKQKRIYFYSIDWSKKLGLPDESDKFGMVNELLALTLFGTYVSYFRNQDIGTRISSLVLKCDTKTVFANGLKNKIYRSLFEKIDNKLRAFPFNGSWKYTSHKDLGIAIADKLSCQDHSTFSKIPYVDDRMWHYKSYFQQVNISNYSQNALEIIRDVLQSEWRKYA